MNCRPRLESGPPCGSNLGRAQATTIFILNAAFSTLTKQMPSVYDCSAFAKGLQYIDEKGSWTVYLE